MYHKNFPKEYFKQKQRELRASNPLYKKSYVYVVNIGDKQYAILQKSHINIKRVSVSDLLKNDKIIKCF